MTGLASILDGIPIVFDDTDRALRFATPALDQRIYHKTARAIQRWTGTTWTVDLPSYADGIPLVADNTARDAAFPAPATNQRVYNIAARAFQRWTGAAWVDDIGSYAEGIPTVADNTARDATFTAPAVNQRVYNIAVRGIQRWTGSVWTTDLATFFEGTPVVADNTARDALYTAPAANYRVYNIAARAIQRYTGSVWTTDLPTFFEGTPVVADNTARDALYPAPAANYRVYNIAARAIQRYTGSVWTTDLATFFEGMPVVADNTARDALYPAPATNYRVYNLSVRMVQRYTGAAWSNEIHILNAGAAASLRFEAGNVVDVVPAAGSNVAGSDLTIAGGQGTGNAAPGRIVLKVAAIGSSGSAVETLFEATVVDVDAGSVKLGVDTPAASTLNATLHLRRTGTLKGLVAVAGAAGQVVPGSAQDDLVIRTQGGSLHFSTDSGASSAMKLNSVGLLVLNQGGNDGDILQLASTDVAHGMTSITDTAAYLTVRKTSATDGVGQIRGFGEGSRALDLFGSATGVDTAKTGTADAPVVLNSDLKSGTGTGNVSANGNLVLIRNNGAAKFIFDADGDSHQDVGTAWTNFDIFDDVEVLNTLAAHVTRVDDPIRDSFRRWIEQPEARATLEKYRLVTFNDDGHHFVNMSKLSMLLCGAVRQLGARLADVSQQVEALSTEMRLLRGAA